MPSFTTNRDRDIFTIRAPEITLAFSLEDGALRALQRAGGPNVIGYGAARPAVDVQIDERGWLAEQTFVRYLRHSVEERDGAVELAIVIGVGPLIVYDRYRITGTLLARRVSVENVGEDPVRLRGVRLELPWARVGAVETCRFDAPGNMIPAHIPLDLAAVPRPAPASARLFAPGLSGSMLERAPTQAPGLLALHNPEIDEALFCWYYNTVDTALPHAAGNGQALTLAHEVEVADWLRTEVALTAGTQYILLLRETWPAALAALRRTWPICGLRALDRPADWVRDAAIYEAHAAQFGGFRGLAAALPALRDLGLNTLCLMPVWDFANHTGRLWDGNWDASGSPYAIRDFDALDSALGDADDLRALVDAAHQHGLRVLIDLPLEGCARDGALVAAHADWFCYDERRRLAQVAGQPDLAAFDWSSDDLAEYLVGWALAQARAYDLDGFRAVAPRAPAPNWERAQLVHASPGGGGVARVLERLQRELKWLRGDAALLGDLAGPAFAASHDFALDEPLHHMFIHLALGQIGPGELVEWLEDYARALPYDAARVGFTESSRTRLTSPLADGLRGSPISRMMLAGMVMCGFAPLIRAGQELEDAAFIRRLLRARELSTVLRRGRVLHNALPCSSPQVFTVLREHAGEHVFGLLNVGPHKHTVTISLPVDQIGLAEGDYELYELIERHGWEEQGRRVWRRDELLSMRLTLDPFAAYCLGVRPAAVEPERGHNGAEAPTLASPADDLAPEALPAVMALDETQVGVSDGEPSDRRRRSPPQP